ncbi:tetratricopeptide repeat protein 24 [Hydra vulgaris]|uniref:Tetratricopeptide repeat protein 24 n=1 Tax=Hydra vulgaris TaxID=6087 RepID=A0ABM4DE03_HYDVU
MTDDKINLINGSEIEQIQQLTELGHDSLKKGQTTQAIELFLKAYNQSKSVSNVFILQSCSFNLGACYIATGSPKNGLIYLKQIASFDNIQPENYADLWYNIGIAHHALNDIDQAVEAYEKARKVYCDLKVLNLQAECESKLGTCYHLQNQLQDSFEMYKNARNSYSILNDRSNECLNLVNAATVAAEMQEIEECAKILDILLDLCHELNDKNLQAKIYHEIGLLYISENLLESGVECFEQAKKSIECESNQDKILLAMVYQNLGALLNSTFNYEKAISYHTKAADIYVELGDLSKQAQVFCNMAFAYAQIHDDVKSLNSFQLAIQAANNSGDKNAEFRATEGLAAIFFRLNDYDKAISTYKNALRLISYTSCSDNCDNLDDCADRIVNKLTDAIKCKLLNENLDNKNEKCKNFSTKGRPRYVKDQRQNTLVAKGLEEDDHIEFTEAESFDNVKNSQQKPIKKKADVIQGDEIYIESYNKKSLLNSEYNDQLVWNESGDLNKQTGKNLKQNPNSSVCLIM